MHLHFGTLRCRLGGSVHPIAYHLLMIHVSHATNEAMHKSPLYHPVDDFDPIGRATSGPMVIVMRNDFPSKNLNEFVATSKPMAQRSAWHIRAWDRLLTCEVS